MYRASFSQVAGAISTLPVAAMAEQVILALGPPQQSASTFWCLVIDLWSSVKRRCLFCEYFFSVLYFILRFVTTP